jgi:hypothetical protein
VRETEAEAVAFVVCCAIGLTRTQRRLTIFSFIPVTRRRWLNRCPLFRKAAGKILTGVLPRDGADH